MIKRRNTATPREPATFKIDDTDITSQGPMILGAPVVEHDYGGLVEKCAGSIKFEFLSKPITLKADFLPSFESLFPEVGTTINFFPFGNKWYLEHYQCEATVSTLNDDGSISFDAKKGRSLTVYSRKAKVLRWLWHKLCPARYYILKVWDRPA